MSIFGWFGGGNTQEAAKPKQAPAQEGGGGGFFSSITNAFGWGKKESAPPPPSAPDPTKSANAGGSKPAGHDAVKDAGKTDTTKAQDPKQTTTPGQTPAPGTKPEEKPVDPKVVRDSANQLFKAMDGWGTDEDALLNTLRGKSPAEVAAIKAEYQDHFGRSLDSDIKKELGGKDLKEAEACLKADPVESAVAALDNAANGGMFGMGTDETKIQSVLENIKDPAQRKQVVEAYQKKTGTSLDQMLKDELSGNDLALSKALLEGDSTKANAVRLDEAMNGGFLGMGTDEDAVYKALESCKDENERKALSAAYQKKTGEPLQKALTREFSGAEKDVADNLLKGDKTAADAARVKVAADDFWGTDEEGIFKSMEGKSKEEREKLIAAYNRQYGGKGGQSFDDMLKSEMGGLDLEKAKQLKDNGKISDEFALKYATDGLGTNEELIRKTLEGKSKTEIDALRKTYKEKYGQDLDQLISGECSGRDGFEIGQMLKGKPQTPEEMIARANEAYEFDRGSGSNWFSRGVTDLFSDSGEVLDYQHQRINQLASQKGKDGSFTEEQKARLGTLTDYQSQDVQNYQAAKDSATNAVATGTAVVVGAVVSIGTAGAASPAVVAALSALFSGASSMAVKYAMQEGGYALEDVGIDAVTTLASAASAGLLKLPGIEGQLNKLVGIADPKNATLMQSILKGGASGALKGGIDSTVGGLMNEANYQGDFGDFLKGMGSQVGTGVAGGFLSGGASGGVTQAMGNGPQGANPYAWSALKGGASGVAGGAAQNLINPAAYSGRPEDIAKQWLTVVGQSGITGALDAVAETRGQIKEAKKAAGQQQAADHGPDGEATPETPDAEASHKATNANSAEAEATPTEKPAKAGGTDAEPERSQQPLTGGGDDDVADVKAHVAAEKKSGPSNMSPEEAVAKTSAQMDAAAESAAKPAATPSEQEQHAAIQELKKSAKTPEDWATIRQWEQEYKKPPAQMTPEEAFAAAKAANANNPEADISKYLSERIPELMEAQTQARVGDNPELQGQRANFERDLAIQALGNKGVQDSLDQMSQKALDYILKTRSTPEAQAEALQKLGAEAKKGYAGAVGTDPETMRAVLEGGNARERMLALANFQSLLGDDVLTHGVDHLKQIFGPSPGADSATPQGGQVGTASFGMDEVLALEQRVNQYMGSLKQGEKPSAKGLFNPLSSEAAVGGVHHDYAAAKAQDMDTKLPGFEAGKVAELMGQPVPSDPTALTGKGESSPLARSGLSVADAQAQGLMLSPREIAAAGGDGGVLPWLTGSVANMVDPSAPFISAANQASMPLKAGISGTTYRFMGIADVLGANPAMARLAAFANLSSIEAHSFHEIASAANGFAGGYNVANPYTPESTGLTIDQLKQIAAARGLSLDALNGGAAQSQPNAEQTAE